MTHGQMIAQKTADVLKSIGYDCVAQGGTFTLPKWGLQVDVYDGKKNEQPGRVAIFPEIVALHRYLPGGFARELGVGLATTLEDAAGRVSANWMLLFFPLMKFMFDAQPHDCLVFDQPIHLPAAPADAGFKLFAGPVQTVGFENTAAPEGVRQTLLWDAFRDALLPGLRPGVHHIRCYAGRMPDGPRADVFLDGQEWAEGSRRLQQLAQTFLPAPDERNPMFALKQHLLIRPSNLESAFDWEWADRTAAWAASVKDQIDPAHRAHVEAILDGLFAMARYRDEAASERALIARGIPALVAGQLTAFLPSAAARVLLAGKVGFSETYFWRNVTTNRAVERRYDQTPLFTAAVAIFHALYTSRVAAVEVSQVGYTSAEMNGVAKVMEKGGKIEKLRFSTMIHSTHEPVDGEDLDQLMAAKAPPATSAQPAPPAAPAKPRWRFW